MQDAILYSPGKVQTASPILVKPKRSTPSPLVSLASGAIAGAVEAFVTYPMEFTKTSVQLKDNYNSKNPLRVIYGIARSQGISALYTGCPSLMVGTAAKAGVRFLTFDTIKAAFSGGCGTLTPTQGLLAGMGAGAVESVLAVTPSERIKTALIDDAKGPRRFKNGLHAIRLLIHENGFGAFYQGLAATTLKQSATSAVRMGSYNVLKAMARNRGISETTATTFAIGSLAGTITVYATQPFDTVKTRSQTVSGSSTSVAFMSIFRESGIKGFWKGSTLRLGRLMLSGGIVFAIYEKMSQLLSSS